MNEHPKTISVIMATHNRHHLLPRAINSVLTQSYPYFELIIVDDGSTDNTPGVVKSIQDPRIIYLRQEPNRGMSLARNRGFDVARGEYITLLDDDDVLLPGALETIINEFARLLSKGIEAPWIWFDGVDAESSRNSGYGIKEEGYISYEDELGGKVQGDYCVVLDRKFLNTEDRFDPLCWGYEHLLWLKLYRKAKAFYIPKALRQNFIQHRGRVSSFDSKLKHIPGITYGAKIFLQDYGEDLLRLSPQLYAEALSFLGSFQILGGEKVEGRRNLGQSLRYRFSLTPGLLYLASYLLSRQTIAFLAVRFSNLRDRRQKPPAR